MTSNSRLVLITGATTGIGHACTVRLAEQGWTVLAGAHRSQDLHTRRVDGVCPVQLDVTEPAHIQAAAERVAERSGGLGLQGLVCSAGVAMAGPLETTSIDILRRTLEVNLVGAVAVAQAVLPALRRGTGRIVLVGSTSGYLPTPLLSYYSASKAALVAIADCLRVELRPWGIHVALVEPGAVATPMWDKGQLAADEWLRAPPPGGQLYTTSATAARALMSTRAAAAMPPDMVARAVQHALTARHPRTRYRVGWDARAQAVLRLLPDRVRDRLLARYFGLERA